MNTADPYDERSQRRLNHRLERETPESLRLEHKDAIMLEIVLRGATKRDRSTVKKNAGW